MDYLQMTDNELLYAYFSERDNEVFNYPLWFEHNKRFISDGDYSTKFERLLTKKKKTFSFLTLDLPNH